MAGQSEAAKRLIAEALAAHPEMAARMAKKSGNNEGDDTEKAEEASSGAGAEASRGEAEANAEGDDDAAADGAVAAAGAPKSRFIEFPLRDVNQYIVCKLCAGYLIDATTISECLHTFCKSCIVKYFNTSRNCPTCGIMVHVTNPWELLRQDRTMQSIINKLVPHVQEEEAERRRKFYGIAEPEPNDGAENKGEEEPAPKRKKNTDKSNVRADQDNDLICFSLQREVPGESVDDDAKPNLKDLEKPFIRTTAKATILHLKKFLALKMGLKNPDDVDILCRGEVLGKEYTLEYVQKTRWRRNHQLSLGYRAKVDFQLP